MDSMINSESIHLTDFTHFLRGFKKKAKEYLSNGKHSIRRDNPDYEKKKADIDQEYLDQAVEFAYTFHMARSEMQLLQLIYIMKKTFQSWKPKYKNSMIFYDWFHSVYVKNKRYNFFIGACMLLPSSNHLESYNHELRRRGFNDKKNKNKLLNRVIPDQLFTASKYFLQFPFKLLKML